MRRAAPGLALGFALLGAAAGGGAVTFTLSSPAFAPGGEVPSRHTCEGDDVSPALAWSQAPQGTQSFALVVDDPDAPDPTAPTTVWVHWVLYNLPAETSGLPQGVTPAALPFGTRQGTNDWRRTGWGGPCPPIGRHRYRFKLYALDTVLPDLGRVGGKELERALGVHVLATAELVGTYKKKNA